MTDEDRLIWLELSTRNPGSWLLHNEYCVADRRDAALMASAQALRSVNGRDHILQLGDVLVCGALVRFTGLDELEGLV